MGFASTYLANKTLVDTLFPDIPAKDTGIIIIIPAFNEPGIIFTLNSLLKCKNPPCQVEVIILVNAPARVTISQVKENNTTVSELVSWRKDNKDAFVNMLFYDAGIQNNPGWGVGMARKMAMDEALGRFNNINNPEGVIVSLDADCRVSENYLEELYYKLYKRSDRKACSIYFEHPLTGELPQATYDAITLYELHLRYYYQSLKYTGYPWVFQTIGSAMAVKAETYAKAGGMSKRKGAEDFYFIQKLIPAGGYFYLNTATVIPSPRISDRVPFGTGPVIAKMTEEDKMAYNTYDTKGFEYLKEFFDKTMLLYDADMNKSGQIIEGLHESLQEFLAENEWPQKLSEIKNNTGSKDSFRKRFFNWFNMFRIVKYMNFLHSRYYLEKIPVEKAAADFLKKTGKPDASVNAGGLLKIYRDMER
ncbi:MAG: glycosyltransferase family 2 protein [Bacteroidales bacterium]|nr:glycosyltransferase family 2 protein [Bacteroidales bacterium]